MARLWALGVLGALLLNGRAAAGQASLPLPTRAQIVGQALEARWDALREPALVDECSVLRLLDESVAALGRVRTIQNGGDPFETDAVTAAAKPVPQGCDPPSGRHSAPADLVVDSVAIIAPGRVAVRVVRYHYHPQGFRVERYTFRDSGARRLRLEGVELGPTITGTVQPLSPPRRPPEQR